MWHSMLPLLPVPAMWSPVCWGLPPLLESATQSPPFPLLCVFLVAGRRARPLRSPASPDVGWPTAGPRDGTVFASENLATLWWACGHGSSLLGRHAYPPSRPDRQHSVLYRSNAVCRWRVHEQALLIRAFRPLTCLLMVATSAIWLRTLSCCYALRPSSNSILKKAKELRWS